LSSSRAVPLLPLLPIYLRLLGQKGSGADGRSSQPGPSE
jgi:hypothetical protein